ncbi:hypothetical protein VOLCADRAFT_104545 [Volvox carteri f. nagariensis]|uniref:Uncharacterized protein n=1 Tax=Volvox carteri f. nagariensis TaxID=3068 RepID=D8TUD1_VOLCA|nr:uncharacterized protein VOLCADRAFT_104545 [Volvox carteri f. nagariensis]EFJ49017.1 hypothetical protein VOLCADRAFT_104545 [Volvox carteri f. nagariensis]|eukprot:XP_002949914.1 hypothetical protein VOLCADRAFT_104545 [Volvox carteri f. nagariensis]
MSDSEEESLPNVPNVPRQKRFRFKTFAERVSEVEVDVYKRLGPVKSEPSSGSWLADGLAHWRELNSAAHFLQAAAEVQPLSQSLPLLLHHKDDIFRILLGSLEPSARLSLPALLDLLSRLARDLQQQFLPLLPKAIRRIVQLLNGGAEREPESLEAIFTCVSYICKHLVRHLAADLPTALRVTAPLRYHHADYVRQFAAQAVGFLLRSAPNAAALRSGVRAVLAEQAVRPTPERIDGAGLLLAESVLGVSHGLHSRAPQVLQLLFKEDLLQPGDLRPTAAMAVGSSSAAAASAEPSPLHRVAVSQEQLRARAAAVARVALARLLDHLRRGKGEELWNALLGETNARLRAFEVLADAAGASGSAVAVAARSLGRALLLVAQAVGYFRGSRVETYKPLMELLGRLMQPAVWIPSTAAAAPASVLHRGGDSSTDVMSSPGGSGSSSSPDASPSRTPAAGVYNDDEDSYGDDLMDVSLSYAVLELVRGVVYGHLKAVGASEGPEVLGRCAVSWAPCFSRPLATEALPFVKSLMVPPAGPEIARLFAPQMMGCLGRFIMGVERLPPAEQEQQLEEQPQSGPQQRDDAGSALLLLRDLCELLQQDCGRPVGLPLLLTAQPHGVRLAAHVRALATGWRRTSAGVNTTVTIDPRVASEAWAAVSLLKHACENDLQAISICEQVLDASSSALQDFEVSAQRRQAKRRRADADSAPADDAAEASLLLLRATATELLAELLQRQQQSELPLSLVTAAETTLNWVMDRLNQGQQDRVQQQEGQKEKAEVTAGSPSFGADYASIRAAGSLLSAVRASVHGSSGGATAMGSGAILDMARELLSESRLRQLVRHLAPLLAHESQPLRAAVLRLLCCFDQPTLQIIGTETKESTAVSEAVAKQKQHKQQQKRERGGDSAASAAGSGGGGGSSAPRCDLLEVLYGINSRPFTIESGRKWTVAMGRLKTYLEYNRCTHGFGSRFGVFASSSSSSSCIIRAIPALFPERRIPEFLVPAFAYGMVGVLYIRFSPLWQPASQALAACLEFRAQESWPIVFSFLKSSQDQLLSGNVSSAAVGSGPSAATGAGRGGGRRRGRHHSSAAISAAITAVPLREELPVSQDASRIEKLDERYNSAVRAGTPQATGGVTDPQNRLSHVLRAMAAAPYSTVEQHSRDWVPLFLEYTAARGSHFDDGEGDVEAAVTAARAAAAVVEAPPPAAAASTIATAAVTRPRKKPRTSGDTGPATTAPPMTHGSVGGQEDDDEELKQRRQSHASAGCSSDVAATAAVITAKRKLPKGRKAAVAGDAEPPTPPPPEVAAAATAVVAATAAAGPSGVSVLSRIGGKTWRAGLLDWLKLVAGLRGVRGLYRSEELQRAVSSHLLESDSGIQVAALRCLRPFRFRWLPPEMADRLDRLADDATLREELAIFPVAPGADGGVGEEARPGLIPLLIRILFPKMRKRSGRLGGRGAPGSARAAILNFLANLRSEELRPLLELLLEPMAAAFMAPEEAPALRAAAGAEDLNRYRLIPPPWWSAPMLGRGVGWWLAAVDQAALDALPARRKVGFLNAFEDLLSHLGHGLEPFLPVMLGITLRLLTTATAAITNAHAAGGGEEEEGVGAAAARESLTDVQMAEQDDRGDGDDVSDDDDGTDDDDGDDVGGRSGGSKNQEAGSKATESAEEKKDKVKKKDIRNKTMKGSGACELGAVKQAGAGGSNAEAKGGVGGDGNDSSSGSEGEEEEAAAELGPLERHREVRSSALRLLAQVWLRFPASTSADYNELWDVFLPAVQPLIPRLQFEAASSKAAAAVTATASNAIDYDKDSDEEEGGNGGDPRVCGTGVGAAPARAKEKWRVQGLGSSLIRGVVAMLSSGRCTEVVRATVLDVLDGVLGCGERLLRRILLPCLPDVLRALHCVIAESWQQQQQRQLAGNGRGRARRRPPTSTAHRELAILERLGGFVTDSELARSLADSLVALLTQAGARSARQRSSSKSGRLDEGGISRALGALAALWGRLRLGDLPEDAVARYCEAMSMWAIRLTARDARAQLAAAYGAVARLLPHMTRTAALLTELTAWSPAALDEVDYDRRLAAYGSLTAAAWGDMDRLQALPLLLTSLYDLRNASDLALRQAAAAALGNLVEALAAAEASADMGTGAGAAVDPPESLLRLTGRVLYPQIKSQLCSPSLAVRQEHLTLLRSLVVALPRRFDVLTPLLSDDVETDFFHNVAHLQSHRRTRALTKLTKLLKTQQAATTTNMATCTPSAASPAAVAVAPPSLLGRCLMDVIVPLLHQFIEEGAGGGGGDIRAHDKKQSDVDKEANVTDAAITALGAVAATLPWPQYEQLLNQFMRMMRTQPAKPLIRAVCAILDNFHFPLPKEDGGEEMEEEKNGGGGQGAAQNQDDEADEDDVAAAVAVYDAATEARAVQRSLLVRVLPALHEQLVERKRGDDEEAASVRAPVALALVKLLKLLPPAAERAELPRALQGVANLLRSRIQRVRDDVRAVLVSMMAELGPRYLPYACHVLRASLPDRGFTAHVIGYTLHAVLEAVVKVAHGESAAAAAAAAVAEPAGGGDDAAPQGYDVDDEDGGAEGGGKEEEDDGGGVGFLDESIELCLPLIEADLFGEVSEAKEVTTFAAQYKEAKRCRANEAYQLLASGITFSTHMRLLLSLVTDRLHLAGQPTIRAKLTQLLQFAARGLRTNPTAGPKPIMALVVGIMEGCLSREEAARARAKAAVGPAASAAAGLAPAAAAVAAAAAAAAGAAGDERAALHETLILEFCLTLLHSGVKRGALTGRSPELMVLLDPALPLLVRSLRSRHAGCVSLALRTLAHVVPLPLPSMAAAAPSAGAALTALLKKVPNIRHPIAQECFRLLAALLRDCDAYQPTTAQLRFLLRWAFEDLGDAGAQPTSFALLRALLGRRVIVPEVYDVMDRVQQIMFLLDFPLGPQRLRQHVGFLLANLEYEYESGRLQVLDMMGQVVAKFPQEVLQAQADVLLMPLVVRLVSDSSAKARAAAGDVLRSLLLRLEAEHLNKAVSYCRAWLERGGGGSGGSAQDAVLRRAAAQTLGIVAEVEGAKFAKRLAEVAPGVLRILERQVALGADGGEEDPWVTSLDEESADAEAACPGWQEAYYCLLLLEKVAAQASSALAWPTGRAPASAAAPPLVPELWEATVRLLLHRHMWVRKAAARLVGYGLAAPRVCGGLMAARPGRAGQLAFAFFLQLECEAADEPTCLQAVKCLVSLSVHLQSESVESMQHQGNQEPNGQPSRKRSRVVIADALDPGSGATGANGSAAPHGMAAERRGENTDDDDDGEDGVDEGREKRRRRSHGGVGGDGEGDEHEDVEEEDGGVGEAAADREMVEEEEDAAGAAAAEAADDAADDEVDGISMATQVQRRAFTLRGLVRRMARLADDARWTRTRQRAAGLRWIAAAASALGAEAIAPHLPVLLRPLYRISEAAAGEAAARHSGVTAAAGNSRVPEDVRQLAEEVMAHLRSLVGSEVLLASYNAAREHVRGLRAERKRRTAMRGMLDPAAAASARLRHNARKAEGRQRKLELMKRERSARQLKQAGRRRGGGGGSGKRPRSS